MIARATVLIPTHRHGPLLRLAVASALAQTVDEIQVFIVLDGADDETRAVARDIGLSDDRVRMFDEPKGERHGEAYRHRALDEATGRIVCYLSDDNLWLPDHVEYLDYLLEAADFAHSLPAVVLPDGEIRVPFFGDAADPWHRQRLLSGDNFIPLSAGGHTLASYRALPEGWSPAPEDLPTDLHMWQKFAADPAVRMVTGGRMTVLHVPSSSREKTSLDERLRELEHLHRRMTSAGDSIRSEAADALVAEAARWFRRGRELEVQSERRRARLVVLRRRVTVLQQRLRRSRRRLRRSRRRLRAIRASASYRMSGRLARAPVIGRFGRWVGRALSRRAAR